MMVKDICVMGYMQTEGVYLNLDDPESEVDDITIYVA